MHLFHGAAVCLIMALRVIPSAAEIRTLLEAKRTSGEATGCVGPTRLTLSGQRPPSPTA